MLRAAAGRWRSWGFRASGSQLKRGSSFAAAAAADAAAPAPAPLKDYDFRGMYRGYYVDESHEGYTALWSSIARCGRQDKMADILREWKEAGNQLSKGMLNSMLIKLYTRSWFLQANKLAGWLAAEKPFEVSEDDEQLYFEIACRLGYSLNEIAKKLEAEPQTSEEKSVILLRTYANCKMVKNAVHLMKKLRDDKVLTSARAYTVMLRLYTIRGDAANAVRIFREYEASRLAPDAVMYCILLTNKETIFKSIPVETIASEALEKLKVDSSNRKDILKILGHLKRSEEVDKLWEESKSSDFVTSSDYLGAIASYDMLGNIEKAEAISDELAERMGGTPLYAIQLALLQMYGRHGMMEKAEEVQERIESAGRRPNFEQCHPLVSGYLVNGNFDRALECFNKFVSKGDNALNPNKLVLDCMVKLLDSEFREAGDVQGAEDLLTKVPNPRIRSVALFNSLLRVYCRAKTALPADFSARMSAAKVRGNADTARLLERVRKMNSSEEEVGTGALSTASSA